MTELRAKRQARIRDGLKCSFCESAPGAFRLHGHHVRPKSLFPDLAAEVSNIITLCLICHIWTVHSGSPADGGKKDGNWRKFVFVCTWLIRQATFRHGEAQR